MWTPRSKSCLQKLPYYKCRKPTGSQPASPCTYSENTNYLLVRSMPNLFAHALRRPPEQAKFFDAITNEVKYYAYVVSRADNDMLLNLRVQIAPSFFLSFSSQFRRFSSTLLNMAKRACLSATMIELI